jgi:hypothetical protein
MAYINDELLREGLGIGDASDEEIQSLVDHPESATYIFADIVSRRAQVGWSTHGHSGKCQTVVKPYEKRLTPSSCRCQHLRFKGHIQARRKP